MFDYTIDEISNFSSGCFNVSTGTRSLEGLDHLSTLVIQSVRCIVLVSLTIASLAFYSSVKVMGKSMVNIGTCSVYWAVCFGIAAFKTVEIILLVWFLPYGDVIRAGFVVITVTQCFVVVMTMMALDHEWTYRSSAVGSKYDRTGLCFDFTQWKYNIFRKALYVTTAVIAPTALLVAVEINHSIYISKALLASFLASLLLPRLLVIVMSVLVFLGKDDLRPTVAAKVLLLLGVICSLAEEIPYFLLTTSGFCLRYASVYDLLQLLGVVAMVLLFLFVRSQYHRVEEECKLAMVWNVQSQLTIRRRITDTTTYHTF